MKTIEQLEEELRNTVDFEEQIELAGMIHSLKMELLGIKPNDNCSMDDDCLSCGS
tara:strand:+ start:249 stop:413 length:165 start_codon:yes stop_codon:yes gene_type:complete